MIRAGNEDVVAGPSAWCYEPLTPISFLERSARVHGDRLAVVDGATERTFAELAARARGLAGALQARRVGSGDVVAVLAPNVSMLLEAHFGVPMSGAALLALNTRLAAPELAYMLGHSQARVLIAHQNLVGLAHEIEAACASPVDMIVAGGPGDEYESFVTSAAPVSLRPSDEYALISINYTSGTTGAPRGVMYHHRGAYLQSLAMALHAGLSAETVFLWTLPMFHCNGWCFPWAVTAVGGTHVCLPKVEPAEIWRMIRERGVTHFNAAPTVLTDLAHHADAGAGLDRPVQVATGGAPPTPTLLAQLADLGITVTHLYGLTETFGPIAICDWHPEWDADNPDLRARRKARQGVANVIAEPLRVVDAYGVDVAADGATHGEIAVRGNDVMAGYLRDEKATQRACGTGWFRTGDVAVMHPDGYVEIRDRAKDVIISGGENISSVEVERVLATHPAVLEAAVVAAPDPRWGEVPAAFVRLKPGEEASADDLIAHVRSQLARFKAPRRVFFGTLPKTPTGKVQKFLLRERLRNTKEVDE